MRQKTIENINVSIKVHLYIISHIQLQLQIRLLFEHVVSESGPTQAFSKDNILWHAVSRKSTSFLFAYIMLLLHLVPPRTCVGTDSELNLCPPSPSLLILQTSRISSDVSSFQDEESQLPLYISLSISLTIAAFPKSFPF